jgi:prepilin-type N-terminal cleavage/methylation domain-containing protein
MVNITGHHYHPYRACREAGVSLIELSLVLAIIGIIISSILIAAVGQTDTAKKSQTEKKLDTLERAFTAYAAINGRLPCPADATIASTSATAGIEYCTGNLSFTVTSLPVATNAPNMSSPAYSSSGTGLSANVVIGGAIPTAALQLPTEFMLDGWGNKFTYAVSKAFTSDGTTTYSFRNTNMGLIKIRDAAGVNRTDRTVMVLVSHGPNGFGAWSSKGTRNTASSNSDELENSELAVAWDEIFVEKEVTSNFDDIVRYKMKWQLVRDAGAVMSESICNTAATVLNGVISGSSGSAYCNSTANPTMDPNCPAILGSLASKVNKLCLQQ